MQVKGETAVMIAEFKESQIEREEFDDFFSKPIFRSGYFVSASVICIGALAYDAAILHRHWHALSTRDVLVLLFVAGILLGLQSISIGGHARVRELYRGGYISDLKRGSALYVVLQLFAKVIFKMVFWGSAAGWVSLVAIAKLLSSGLPK